MCGIAGKVLLGVGQITLYDLKQMSLKIERRGPDDEGIFISPDRKVGLVNRRLAIIDLSRKGHQPMNYRDKYMITYNGEIYNFLSEKKKLERQGYKFHSGTDTEVILALYDKYKENCLRYIRGMFAFAIYDSQEETLFLARDRIGKKPLKYYFKNGNLIFASELKAILTQKEVSATVDYLAIHHYLTYGFAPAPLTGFENIKKLKPGHYLLVNLRKKTFKTACYWRPDFGVKLNLGIEEWSKRILEELEEATRLRMVADVPVGALLSGGVDSSAVVAMMAKHSKNSVKTFSITFKEKEYNEASYARKVAKMFNTQHSELVAEPTSVEMLPDLVYQYEEPYANSSAIVMYMISKLAKKYVTVALNGDGGDESFAGYDRYCRFKRDVALNNILKYVRPVGIPLTKTFDNISALKRANKFLVKSQLSLAERFVSYNSFFLNTEKSDLYTDYFQNLIGNANSNEIVSENFGNSKAKDLKDQALYSDLVSYLPDDLLAKADIASMAVSLELRSPFLDHKMIELAAKIPFDLKVHGLCLKKFILKKSLEKILPKDILYRKKAGFSIPLSKWFEGELKEYASLELLSKGSKTKSFFKKEILKSMLKTHNEKNDMGNKLWAVLTLELWLKSFFK